jgi:hypothetical protein
MARYRSQYAGDRRQLAWKKSRLYLPTTVPLPASAWLMMGGLCGLGAIARKKRRLFADLICGRRPDRNEVGSRFWGLGSINKELIMRRAAFAALLCAFSLASVNARAVAVDYEVNASFFDGGTLEGNLNFDLTTGKPGEYVLLTTPTVVPSMNVGNASFPATSYADDESTFTEVSPLVFQFQSADGAPNSGLLYVLQLNLSQPLSATGGDTIYAGAELVENYKGQQLSGRGLSGGTITILPTAVPLPASAWLMLCGLSGLGAIARKKSAAFSRLD